MLALVEQEDKLARKNAAEGCDTKSKDEIDESENIFDVKFEFGFKEQNILVDIKWPLQNNEGISNVCEIVEVDMPHDFEKDDLDIYDPIEAPEAEANGYKAIEPQ